jgi:hypothetical protein
MIIRADGDMLARDDGDTGIERSTWRGRASRLPHLKKNLSHMFMHQHVA